MADLSFLKNQIEEAVSSIDEAVKGAVIRNLPGTTVELKMARSYLNSALYEMERKEQAEFAPFRDAVGKAHDPA